MSEHTGPSKKDYIEALTYLFAFATLSTNHGISIGESEIADYADIGMFLGDEVAVTKALLVVAERMRKLFELDKETFEHPEGSRFVQRNLGKQVEFTSAGPMPKGLRQPQRVEFNNLEKAKQQAQLRFTELQIKFAKASNPSITFQGHNGVFVRRFRFRKLLVALEIEYLGLVDDGLVLTADVPIAQLLRDCKVWKDSIGFDHGEYTHRLQWLAIAVHFDWDKVRLRKLYRGSCASLKRSVLTAFGYGQLTDIKASELIALPVNVWEFLFDARQTRGKALDMWPFSPGVASSEKPHERYRHAQRANSCRVPVVLNNLIRNNAMFGILHAYLSASHIKLIHVQPSGGKDQERALVKYRKDRIAHKDEENLFWQLQELERKIAELEDRLAKVETKVLFMFDQPHSHDNNNGLL